MLNLTGYWSLLYQIPVGLIGLSFLVFIHEMGHFLVAKWAGVKVNTFSIGFGKKLIKWKRGETEYCISLIPFGGYVAMAGEQPGEETGGKGDFQSISVPKRILIALAGPVVNLVFAFVALAALYLTGVQEAKNNMVVGDVLEASPAETAGVMRGDLLLSYKGKAVESWDFFMQEAALDGGKEGAIQVKRDSDILNLKITPVIHEKLGIAMAGLSGEGDVTVESLVPGKPAEKMGLLKGDIIRLVDGFPVASSSGLVELINKSKGQEVQLSILRSGQEQLVNVTPVKDPESERFVIGIYPILAVPTALVKRGFGESITKSWDQNLYFASALFRYLGGLFTGQVKAKALSGPIGILQMIANSLQYSIQRFIEFLAMISMNLGIMNLLPLAITDGGLILFLLLEAIRRKPLSTVVQMRINQVAMAFFLLLAIFVTTHDIIRIPWFLN